MSTSSPWPCSTLSPVVSSSTSARTPRERMGGRAGLGVGERRERGDHDLLGFGRPPCIDDQAALPSDDQVEPEPCLRVDRLATVPTSRSEPRSRRLACSAPHSMHSVGDGRRMRHVRARSLESSHGVLGVRAVTVDGNPRRCALFGRENPHSGDGSWRLGLAERPHVLLLGVSASVGLALGERADMLLLGVSSGVGLPLGEGADMLLAAVGLGT